MAESDGLKPPLVQRLPSQTDESIVYVPEFKKTSRENYIFKPKTAEIKAGVKMAGPEDTGRSVMEEMMALFTPPGRETKTKPRKLELHPYYKRPGEINFHSFDPKKNYFLIELLYIKH
jgi:hypothetical protein